MATRTRQLAPGLVSVDRDGATYMGIDTGIGTNSPSLRKLAGQKRQSGWIVGPAGREEWRPEGFVEHEGSIHVYGPLSSGRFIDSILEDKTADRLAAIERIALTYRTLAQRGTPVEPIHTRTIMLLDDGRTLVLPLDIMQAIREHQDYAGRIRTMELYSHPERSPADNVGFFIASMVYYVLTSRHPFEGRDEEEIHTRVRAADPIPANYLDFTIRQEIADALHAELSSAKIEPDAGVWAQRISDWRVHGWRADLAGDERAKLEQAAAASIARSERAFRRREFVRRKGRTTLIIAALVVVIGSIPGTIIYNRLQPRSTAGFEPEKVVRTFYTSMNTLDHMTMEDAVVDGAGRDMIREVTNLFVLDRQRMSVEMQSGFVDAQAWRDAGMPALSNNRSPYGVANLTLEASPAAPEERRFLARYERWMPDYDAAEQTGTLRYLGFDVVEDVFLRLDREDWVIHRIDRLQEERLDLANLRNR